MPSVAEPGNTAITRDAHLPYASPLLFRGFRIIARRRVAQAFRGVRALHPERLRDVGDGPAVVYLNHPSWWDPLLCMTLVDRLLPNRMHYAPMGAAALHQYRFFKLLGMFPVEEGTPRGATQFLRAATAVLRSHGLLWITAQGHFTDARTRPVKLMPGLGALLSRTREAVTVLPLALEYSFWNQRLPEALVAFGEPLHATREQKHSAEEWTHLLEEQLSAAQDELAATALLRDPARFHTVLEGSRGTAGFYGRWQRVRSLLFGERNQVDHEATARAEAEPAAVAAAREQR